MARQALHGWTLVFDLDGTLIDTAPDLHAALNHCLETGGFRTVPFEAIRGMIGEGAKAMIRKGLEHTSAGDGEDTVEALWPGFIDYYSRNICRLSRPFPGMETALAAFAADGATCAVCTNKTQRLAEEVLEGLGLTARFSVIVGADSVPRKKPDGGHILQTIERSGGDRSRAIMIGDSQTDERAARHAGLPFIYVPFGYGPEPDTPASDLLIAESYEALPALIASITG